MRQQTVSDWLFISGSVFAILIALALQLTAITRQSFVADEPFFLLAGYRAVRDGTNTLNLEHPPLVKMLAALPLVRFSGPDANPTQLIFLNRTQATFVRLASRALLLVTVAIPFLIGCFLLGREVATARVGLLLALSLAFSFQVIPYLAITQTDAAVSLGYVLTLVAAIRFLRQPTFARAGFLGLGFGTAIATKFSGLLLLPSIGFVLFMARDPQALRVRRWALGGVVFAVALLILYSTYKVANWHYDAVVGRETISRYCQSRTLLQVDEEMRPYESMLLRLEEIDPLLAQWSTGVIGLAIQNRMGVWTSYAFGLVSSHGWWWFFPLLLLIRTPVTILFASGCSLLAWRRSAQAAHTTHEHAHKRKMTALLVLTAAVYLGMALLTSYNMGIRHLLPILPVLYLPAICWAARRRSTSCFVVGSLLLEAVVLQPIWMSATNTWWLGDRNPTRCAAIADCEYKQNFLALDDVRRRYQRDPFHVAFPLLTEAELAAYLPGAIMVDPTNPPRPGWHAVNVFIEEFFPAVEKAHSDQVHNYHSLIQTGAPWKRYADTVRSLGKDHGYVAGTFHLYYLPPSSELK